MAKALWKKIKGELSGQLPAHAISTWFEPIEPITKEGCELILEVPNQFFYDWIESHYRAHLNKALVSVGEGVISTRFIISADKQEIKPDPNQDLTPTKKSPLIPVLNKDHKFELFIEGSNNQFAKTAAEAVAENPGKQSFNPLIIYGGTGLGKTHLLHAIGNRLLETKPDCRIVIATSEKFTLDFVNGLRKNRTIEFARHYRQADILLIDDIQFFRGKEQTQEQFFHTFNELFHNGKQIVMTADRYPGEMIGLQERLLSRFKSGLSVDIQPPDFETRVAIAMEKAEQNGLKLPYDIIELIGTHIKKNVRDIEGTIIRLLAHASLSNREIDYSLTKKVIKERLGKSSITDLTVEDIVRRVSETTHIKEKEIVGASRKMEITEARQISIYLCREILGTPLVSIGMHFGGRDHSTVLHACRVIGNKTTQDHRIGALVGELKNELSFALN